MKLNLFFFILMAAFFSGGCNQKTPTQNIQVAGVQAPVIPLTGSWKFNMEPPADFWKNEVDFRGWADIQVPGECQMQGFAIKHDQPFVYKKEFLVPDDYKGKQIRLAFYGVYSYARVWVNGHFIREHSGGFTKWECNISDVVTPGEISVLTVEVTDRTDDISYGSGYAKHQIGGILRNVELLALPDQSIKQLYFETDLDAKYLNAVLEIFYELEIDTPTVIRIELFNPDDIPVGSVVGESKTGQLSMAVKNPEKWDAEHPKLYTVTATLIQDRKEVMKTSEKIGFREVLVEGNQLMVNGMPVKLRGSCRHDIHPTLGRMTTAEFDLQDVLLAKECNMNFIRTSHYPPSESFLNFCDQYGIYVEDETAVCFVGSHRMENYRAKGATQSDPAYTGRYISQLEEMVQNHRNHPCIIIWSIGNENVFGSNFEESYKWVKKNDPTRPVIYSYPGQVPDSLINYEIISMHYPSWRGDLNQYGVETKGFKSVEMPMLFDEWAHVACYNNFEQMNDPNVRSFWGQSLDSMWTYLFEAEGGLGGAIWCMLDETFMLPEELEGFNEWWGILDRRVIPATFKRPVVGYGEWGIVDTWRRKKPEFWGTKKAYSPTKIYTKTIADFKTGEELAVNVHNRYDHTNFSELKIKWGYGIESGEISHISLEPHQKGQIVFPAINWNSDEKLHIQFFQHDTLLVDEYNLQLGEKEMNLPELTGGSLDYVETEMKISFAGKDFAIDVNKENGLLENLTVNRELILKSGPYVNLQIPGTDWRHSNIHMEDYATEWRLDKLDYDVKEGLARIRIDGHYDKVSASFDIQFDGNGVFTIDYHIDGVPSDKFIQEAGIKFITGENFERLAWNRDSYFTAYPPNDLGRSAGRIDLNQTPTMNYRQEPSHDWEMDAQGFYYFGLDTTLPYTHVVRSLKENIYSYTLGAAGSRLDVLSPGTLACRFDQISGNHTLIVNNLWDYNSLGWGNYHKQIKLGKELLTGQVVFTVGMNQGS